MTRPAREGRADVAKGVCAAAPDFDTVRAHNITEFLAGLAISPTNGGVSSRFPFT